MHVHLEPLEHQHLEFVRSLRNSLREHFFNTRHITQEQQLDWYETYLQSNTLFWVIRYGDQLIGTISLTLREATSDPPFAVYEIGNLMLLPKYRGEGFMRDAMSLAREWPTFPCFFIAHVKPNNRASLRLFKRAGFWRVPRARQ